MCVCVCVCVCVVCACVCLCDFLSLHCVALRIHNNSSKLTVDIHTYLSLCIMECIRSYMLENLLHRYMRYLYSIFLGAVASLVHS